MALKSQKFFKRWQRTLTDHLDGVSLCLEDAKKTKGVEALHDLRVTIRRSRVLVRLGKAICGKSLVNSLERWSKAVNQAAGRVRDYDVTLEWLRTQNCGAGMIQQIERRRHRLAQAAAQRVVAMPLTLHKKLVSVNASNRKRNQLKKHYLAWKNELEHEVLKCAGHLRKLDVPEQHKLRRRLRKLRYLTELVLGRRKQKRHRFLRQLIRVQRALGEMQDRVVVESILRRLKKIPKHSELRDVAQQEHAAWLYKAEQELIELARLER